MANILALLTCLTLQIDSISLKQLGCIIQGMFAMTGRVTMLGISRWNGADLSIHRLKNVGRRSLTMACDRRRCSLSGRQRRIIVKLASSEENNLGSEEKNTTTHVSVC